jgi:hypothetical protein
MMRRLVAVAACLAIGGMTGCASSAPASGETTTSAATTRTTSAASAPVTQALADGKIPTDCSYVTDAEHLAGLGVASQATSVYTDPATTAMPTTEEQAQQEDRNWPGLGCLYPSADAEQEATILVMPDTSPFFTQRETTTCLPTYAKGAEVDLGSVKGWYCPTTNETPGEWVSFVHHGRLVSVNRTSKPNGGSPYKDVLISYASWLAGQL